jgi:hypothetical protein
VLGGAPQSVFTVVGDVHREALGLEAALEGFGEPVFVLDHQHSHVPILAGRNLKVR